MTNKATQNTMRAVQFNGKPYEMIVSDVPRPKLLTPRDAICRIEVAAICGTDLHTYHGLFGSPNAPFIMGHEAIGIVDEVGDGVSQFKKGDRVVIMCNICCGFCDGCTRGNYPYCQTTNPPYGADGYGYGESFGPGLGGLQAEYARVPYADENCFILPPGKYDPTAMLLIGDIFATGWSGLDYSGFQPGDSVAIFGAGPMGMLCAYSALLRGASVVYSIDHVQTRLDEVARIGAIPIDFSKEDPVKRIKADYPEGIRRSVDCCGFECVDAKLKPDESLVIRQAISVTAQAGGIGLMGVYGGGPPTEGAPLETNAMAQFMFPIADYWGKGLSMRGGAMEGRKLAPMLRDLIVSGRAKPEFIFSSEIDIEQASEYYQRFSDHEETKVLIRFNATPSEPDNKRVSMMSDSSSFVDDQESQTKERLQAKMAKLWALEAEMDKLLHGDESQGQNSQQNGTSKQSLKPSNGDGPAPRLPTPQAAGNSSSQPVKPSKGDGPAPRILTPQAAGSGSSQPHSETGDGKQSTKLTSTTNGTTDSAGSDLEKLLHLQDHPEVQALLGKLGHLFSYGDSQSDKQGSEANKRAPSTATPAPKTSNTQNGGNEANHQRQSIGSTIRPAAHPQQTIIRAGPHPRMAHIE